MNIIFQKHKQALGIFVAVSLLASLAVSAHFRVAAKSGAFTADTEFAKNVGREVEENMRQGRNDSTIRDALTRVQETRTIELRVEQDLQNQLKPEDYADAQKRRFARPADSPARDGVVKESAPSNPNTPHASNLGSRMTQDRVLNAQKPEEQAPLAPNSADDSPKKSAVSSDIITIQGTTTIMFEDAEGDFPGANNWLAYDGNADGGSDYWDDVNCKTYSGAWSLWSAGAGSSADCTQYDNNMNSWMIYGPFDLRGATSASLSFYYWNMSEQNYDQLLWLASSDGSSFSGFKTSGDSGGWRNENMNLSSYIGDSSVWIAFAFQSDSSVTGEGAYLDNISLTKSSQSPPDLTLDSGAINKIAVAPGEQLSVDLVIKNQGEATAGASKVYYYFEKDARSFTNVYKVGEDTVGALGSGGTESEHFDYTVPGNASDGIYYFYFWIDAESAVTESSEDNNAYYWTITVANKPDLTLQSGTLNKAVFKPGETINSEITIQNIGAGNAPAHTVYYYFEKDAYSFNNQFKVGEVPVDALSPGASVVKPFQTTIPSNASAGTYYLQFWIDGTQVVNETSEDNNKYYWEVSVDTRPDLYVPSGTINKSKVRPGESVATNITVENIGATSAGAHKVYYYFQKDDFSYTTQYKIGDRSLGSLSSGSSSNVDFSYVVPSSISPGTYYLYFWLDAEGAVNEFDENNNRYYWLLTVSSSSLPDITKESAVVNKTTIAPGGTLALDVNVKNIGTAPAEDAGLVYYYFEPSVNGFSFSDSAKKGEDDFPVLSPGANSQESFSYTIPQNTPSGAYYLYFWIDAGNRIFESNEDNNAYYLNVTVTGSGMPDITMSEGTITTDFILPGQSLSLDITIKNIGTVGAGNGSKVYYYFEKGGISYSNDYKIGEQSFPGLGPQATSRQVFTYSVPSSASSGSYFLYFWIDAPGAIVENDETNNAFYAEVTVGEAPLALDHFTFSFIASPQSVNVPFPVTITARDPSGARLTSFNETVGLSSNAGAGSVSPSNAKLFNGEWQGTVTVYEPGENIYLTTGTFVLEYKSNSFTVQELSPKTSSISGEIVFTFANQIQSQDISRAVSVYLAKLDGTVVRTLFTDHIDYAFKSIPCGEYQVYAVHSETGKRSQTYSVYASCGRPVTKDISLAVCDGTSDKNPVLLVPGVMGSRRTYELLRVPVLPRTRGVSWSSGVLKLSNPFNIVGWDTLKDILVKKEHYTEGCNLFDVPYDWRLDLNKSVDLYLKPWIEYAKDATGKDKVDIIAHSMGGLLARAYIQGNYADCTDVECDIGRFAMVGTPNGGSANAYYLWEGADPKLADDIIGDGIWWFGNKYWTTTRVNYEVEHYWSTRLSPLEFFQYSRIFEYYTGSPWKNPDAQGNDKGIPALKALLPTYEFLLPPGVPADKPILLEKIANNFLRNLNTSKTRDRMGDQKLDSKKVATAIFVGTGQPTITKITVGKPGGPLYQDGVPLGPPQGGALRETKGDGTVLDEKSADLPYKEKWAYAKVPGVGAHSSLIKLFTPKLAEFLNDEIPAGIAPPVVKSNNFTSEEETGSAFSLSFDGRVTPYITDPQGRGSGINSETGERENNIPGAEVTVRSDSGGIVIENPISGNYAVSLTSPYTEDYILHTEFISSDAEIANDYRVFAHGATSSLTIAINPSAQEKITISGVPLAPQSFRADPINMDGLVTRLTWEASFDTAVTGYRVYAKQKDDLYLHEAAVVETPWYDTGDLWAENSSIPTRLYAVSAVTADGKESFLAPLTANDDRDYDGLTDVEERDTHHTNISRPDTDDDGLSDYDEVVKSTNPLLQDTDGDTFSDYEEAQFGSDPLDETSFPQAIADLAVTITEDKDPIASGEIARYTITASNNGPEEAPNVTVTDALNDLFELAEAITDRGSCTIAGSIATCSLGTLETGATSEISISAKTFTPGVYTTSAEISGAVGDPNSANNSAEAGTTVVAVKPSTPTLNDSVSPTREPLQILTGGKDSNTAIIINSEEVVPLNTVITWSYEAALSEGINEFSISARDEFGNESDTVETTIALDTIPPSGVMNLAATPTRADITLSWNWGVSSESTAEAQINTQTSAKSAPFVPGEFLVKFKPGREKKSPSGLFGFFAKEKSITQFAPGLYKVVLKNSNDLETVMKSYRENKDVEYASPNYIITADFIPTDPRFIEQWGLDNTGQTGGAPDSDIDAPEGWDIENGASRPVVVAVIDSGVDYTNPDLLSQIMMNEDEVAGNGIDDDGNGYIDDIRGWDMTSCNERDGSGACISPKTPDNDPMDEHSHGTHVAGIIGAEGNNGVGVIGVNPSARIMLLRFLDKNGVGTTADAIEAVYYAIQNGAEVMNASFGGGGFSQPFYDALNDAQDRGMIFVAAAGNGGEDASGDNNDISPHYPSSYDLDSVIAVAASDNRDALASFSNYGPSSVDIAAPGVSVLSAVPGDAYALLSGTSMAAPHVTGIVSLMRSKYPNVSVLETRLALFEGVDQKTAFQGKLVSGGRANLRSALQSMQTPYEGTLNIYRAQTPFVSLTDASLIAELDETAKEYTDNTVSQGILYYYAVTVKDAALNESAPMFASGISLITDFELSGFAWSGTIGWISFSCKNREAATGKTCKDASDASFDSLANIVDYGVMIDGVTGAMRGYAWNDSLGWISFNRADAGVPPSAPYNTDTETFIARLQEDDTFTGWARAITGKRAEEQASGSWDGWIKLSGNAEDGTPYGLSLNKDAGELSGWMYGGDIIGWISANCENRGTCENAAYSIVVF